MTTTNGPESAPAGLSPAERRALAAVLIEAAADLLETPEVPATLPADLDREAARHTLGVWLARLPGAAANWDDLLIWPPNVSR